MSPTAGVLAAAIMILPATTAVSAPPPPADPAARARAVLAAAREALGGEKAVASVQSISLEGELRRQAPGEGGDPAEVSGGIRVDALPPDHYLRVETISPVPGMPGIPLATALDGTSAWVGALPHATGANVIIRSAAAEDAGAQARLDDRVRRDAAVFVLALLTRTDGAEATWVAEAEAPEGRADVVQVTAGAGLDVRLFVDQKTHRPLMLTFREAPPRMMMMRRGPGGPDHRPGEGPDARPAAPPPPAPVEATLFVGDWKRVGGLLLPHTLRKSHEGKPYEEIVVTRYTLGDPKLTADRFRKKG
jgi:hypothetical protein